MVNNPNNGNPSSTAYTYTYDNQGRPITMGMGIGSTYPVVNGLQFNASDRITQISYGLNGDTGFGGSYIQESRNYNALDQVTSISSSGYPNFSEQYVYASGQNNGQVSSVLEGSGEMVSYQYDGLKRLTKANSTFGWSQQYTYDGFGNITYKTGSFNMPADPSTNRLMGYSYDANGNMYQGNWGYDVENRLVGVGAAGGERYMYDPSNKRVYKQSPTTETYFFYGIDGKVLGEYYVTWPGNNNIYYLTLNLVTESAYFGGKKVKPSFPRDRLGSVRPYGSSANRPYGENYPENGYQSATGLGTDGFATYYQDSSTALNYADQRYYNATFGRFITQDPYWNGDVAYQPPGDDPSAGSLMSRVPDWLPQRPEIEAFLASGSPGPSAGGLDWPAGDPPRAEETGDWRRLAYVGGDPVGRSDPTGLAPKAPKHFSANTCFYLSAGSAYIGFAAFPSGPAVPVLGGISAGLGLIVLWGCEV